ncbi:MAG: flagellar basal body rod protein FlgB [Deltaproteobacteria bacterium]|nr:flagellar basal body rod protein FlgB [Deltaproteobacteria bacterium]
MEFFEGAALKRLERTLDLTAFRQRLISSNIANEETPNYKAKDIDFKKELEGIINGNGIKMTSTNEGHFPDVAARREPFVVESEDNKQGLDMNTVSLEKEMVKMAENTLLYNVSVTLLAREFEGLRNAIREGK